MLQGIELKKVTPHCGAEVRGVDLSRPLDADTAAALERALAENCVLFFRDQTMTPEQHKALGRSFGELHLHPAWPRLVEGHPEIMEIYADDKSKRVAGEDWHSDVSCDPEPPLGEEASRTRR
jgi:taurine dioxygenase